VLLHDSLGVSVDTVVLYNGDPIAGTLGRAVIVLLELAGAVLGTVFTAGGELVLAVVDAGMEAGGLVVAAVVTAGFVDVAGEVDEGVTGLVVNAGHEDDVIRLVVKTVGAGLVVMVGNGALAGKKTRPGCSVSSVPPAVKACWVPAMIPLVPPSATAWK
jgi:hypothetical protein